MRNKIVFAVLFAIQTLFFHQYAPAAPVNFNIGSQTTVDTSQTSSGLTMYFTPNANLDNTQFSLDVGQSRTFTLGKIGTIEPKIDADDLIPKTITARFYFDSPSLPGQPIDIYGTVVGRTSSTGFLQGWKVTWEGTKDVDFGDGGKFTLSLNNINFISLFWKGPAGERDVTARLHLNSSPNPVPIPSTLLLLGSGLAGIVIFRRRAGRRSLPHENIRHNM